jgi:hypothetical protein
MKKTIIAIIAVAIVGVAYWLISPLFIDKRVSEGFPIDSGGVAGIELSLIKKQGSFVGFDSIHHGSGDVVAIDTEDGWVIRFEENFNVANGPDLYVGFGRDGEYAKGTEIGRLKGNIGSQNYLVPEDINIEDYNEVWVWCRAFSTPFARARLESI